jgi:hypothetical protein
MRNRTFTQNVMCGFLVYTFHGRSPSNRAKNTMPRAQLHISIWWTGSDSMYKPVNIAVFMPGPTRKILGDMSEVFSTCPTPSTRQFDRVHDPWKSEILGHGGVSVTSQAEVMDTVELPYTSIAPCYNFDLVAFFSKKLDFRCHHNSTPNHAIRTISRFLHFSRSSRRGPSARWHHYVNIAVFIDRRKNHIFFML